MTMTDVEITAELIDKMSAKRLNQYVLETGLDKLPDDYIELPLADKQGAVKAVLFGTKMPKAKAKPIATSKKAKGKSLAVKKPKGNGAVVASKKGEVLPPVQTIEMPDVDFDAITNEADAVTLAKDLVEVGEFALFHLGGVFSRMVEEGWFMGHPTFRACSEIEFGVKYRKAAYLISIFRVITEKGIDYKDVSKVGWTKLKEMLPILTPKNAASWAKKAQGMSTVALIEHVKAAGKSKGNEVVAVPDVSTRTFKLHADQRKVVTAAIDDAKIKGGTDVDSVALELICQDYLGHAKPIDPVKITKAYIKSLAGTKTGLAFVAEALTKNFKEVDVSFEIPEDYAK